MKDLTTGHPGRVLFSYTLPLFGSIIFQQMYNLADSLVAGRYIGTEALAAVGNSYEITLIYIALAVGCNIGTSVITARLFGEKRYGDVRSACRTSLIFAGGLGLALTLLGMLLSQPLLLLINTPPELMADSKVYLDIYLLGYVFLILYQVATGLFSALGDSRTPFWFLAVSSVVNIIVDIIFVRDLHMGVPGVAWATLICQSVSGLLAVICILRKLRQLPGSEPGRTFDKAILGSILRIAMPSAIQQSCISIGNIMIQGVINGFGTAATGGYAAAIKLNNMTITSLTAVGNGVSNFTSQNLGARKHDRVRQGLKHGILQSAAIALAFTAAYQLLCRPLLGCFITGGTEVSAQAMDIGALFLRVVTPFYAVVAAKLASDGVLRGSSLMTPFMVCTMTDLVLRVALSFLLSPALGILGVWLSWPIGWSISAAMSVWVSSRKVRHMR